MIIYLIIGIVCVIWVLNKLSYKVLNKIIFNSKKWELNICCGKTDGGGVNADIYKHKDVPNFVKLNDIYTLPFRDKEFKTVLCSHTMEHVDDPTEFFKELERVGEEVTLVLPPLYDIAANLNVVEHKWIFLSFKKKHSVLPRYIKLPFSRTIHKKIGQKISA
jgi:hypothetical protein